MGILHELTKQVALPKMVKVRQVFPESPIDDVVAETRKKLEEEGVASRIKPGMRVAVTAGSRGVANIAIITKTVIDFVNEHRGKPFIVPSMGSHGGATEEGQLEILNDYNVTESFCGCPILSSMETVEVGKASDGRIIYTGKDAFEADGIIVLCRVKPHTAFRGEYESGILKMLAVGMGKRKGAESIHLNGFRDMATSVKEYGSCVMDKTNVIFAVVTIENANDQTHLIEVVKAEEIIQKEPALQQLSKDLMAKIIIPEGDVLIVDEIGKNISGDGQDPNITGNFITPYASGGFKKSRTVFLDLSHETHGNAVGIGMADVVTQRLVGKIDHEKGYANAMTSMTIEGYKVPVTAENDRDAIKVAVKSCPAIVDQHARIVRIKNTHCLEEIYISEPLLEKAAEYKGIIVMGKPEPFNFDQYGNLFE